MPKVAIGVPSPELVYPEFTESLLKLYAYSVKNIPNLKLFYDYKTGARTDRNRNSILQDCIDRKVDYILWFDTDMVYPKNMLYLYLKEKFDVIGCKYYKRIYPYTPIFYNTEGDGFKPISDDLPDKKVIEVGGVGFGGMMVDIKVYKKLGKNKWMKYGDNFHLPYQAKEQLSHDLQFCREVKKAGMTVKLHTGVSAGHIGHKIVSEKDWLKFKAKPPKIAVIMPATDMKMAKKAGDLMMQRAGIECKLYIIQDEKQEGFMNICNKVVRQKYADYYVYVAQDAFAGRNWLLNALNAMHKEGYGLLAFNDGKWGGKLASFGMVEKEFMLSNYGGDLFYSGYKSHYGDTELTLVAMQKNKYGYEPDAVLTEADYEKDGKSVNQADKRLFNLRKNNNFDDLVTDPELVTMFA